MDWDPWDEIYLIATLAILFVAYFRDVVARDCAILLLVWFAMANKTYVYGEIESIPTIVIGTLYVHMCIFLIWKYKGHWLPIYLCGSGVMMVLWSFAYTGPDPYTYKAVKNMIYIGELFAVLIGFIKWRIPSEHKD